MIYDFGYGTGTESVSIPESRILHILHANQMEHENTGAQAVEKALFRPIGSEGLTFIA